MPQNAVDRENAFGSDVELAFYGWSRAPIYASGTRVWPLDDSVFEKMIESREPIWQRVVRDGVVFRVLLLQRPRRHLRARLPGGHVARTSHQPG